MQQTSVQKLAQILRIMVIVVFICNILALFFAPMLYLARPDGAGELFNAIAHRAAAMLQAPPAVATVPDDQVRIPFLTIFLVSWLAAFTEAGAALFTLLMLFCGVCTAVILWQAKRVLDTILAGNPFQMANARNMNRAAVSCLLISGVALARLIYWLLREGNPAPLFTYNALFVPTFLMAGLLFLVMSALFRQAAELQEDQDLTI